MSRACARIFNGEHTLRVPRFSLFPFSQKLQNFKSCPIDGLVTFGDDLVLRWGKSNRNTGVLCHLFIHSRRTETKRWKETAPPILPLSLAKADSHGDILPCGKAKAIITACGIALKPHLNVNGVIKIRFTQDILRRFGQKCAVFFQAHDGFLFCGTILQERNGNTENSIPNRQFDCLIFLVIRVGKHVQAHDLIIDLLFPMHGQEPDHKQKQCRND